MPASHCISLHSCIYFAALKKAYSTGNHANYSMAKRYDELVNKAQQAKKRAHAPYSNFPVGAALLALCKKSL